MELCTQCLNQVKPNKGVRGYFVIEILLYILMILPGILYTLWRITGGREKTCPTCGGHAFVPIDSPAGKALLASIPQPEKKVA